jgi:hypothetical protein
MREPKVAEAVAASADENEDFLRRKAQRNSFATASLAVEKVKAIANTRMHPRHKRLDALLDGKLRPRGRIIPRD